MADEPLCRTVEKQCSFAVKLHEHQVMQCNGSETGTGRKPFIALVHDIWYTFVPQCNIVKVRIQAVPLGIQYSAEGRQHHVTHSVS